MPKCLPGGWNLLTPLLIYFAAEARPGVILFCPDVANLCKPSTAVYRLLIERFDEDPFLLFTLRGRPKEKALAALRAERGGALPARKAAGVRVTSEDPASTVAEPRPEIFVPLEEAWSDFWRARTPLEELPASVTPASLPDALVRAQEEPAFWCGPGRLHDHLSTVYETVTREAMMLAEG